MQDRIETAIPGRAAIELISFYEEFRSYYPQCEMETKRWFVENVRPDWWICDVGANIGYYSILFSQLATNGRVLAFEPTSTAAMLRKNLEYNKVQNVEVHEVALGAVTGLHQDRIFRVWGEDGELQFYPFYKLDDFIKENATARLDCIKIDVDSFDFEVLRGAEQTLLQQNPLIVVELNHALSKRNQSAGEALAWLADRGYQKALVLDHDNFVLRRGEETRLNVVGASKLELVFPPPMRFEESLDNVVGVEVASPLLNIGQLQNGAKLVSPSNSAEIPHQAQFPESSSRFPGRILEAARKLFSQPDSEIIREGGNADIALLIGNSIETSADIWNYALLLEFNSDVLQSLPPDCPLAVEVVAEVTEGKLGIALSGRDTSNFSSSERTMDAMPDVQSIVVTAHAAHLKYLILRNVAVEGTKTVFKLASIQVKARRSPYNK